ncbi:7-cyano-7-deazaguanine synthase QueC [Desulfosporosinus fructosivorans]|uniref:7-cyano-7-deazaguanine synthase n=1 Tax=Desulfosporosinus fructosivorans TaxID=2018669 RepID=A0A4Z0R982_9FIRM|nr:7-cyano-7-deazaguanine synthase QueC [Desulfosporosinus fructosivorans]TGE38597.1 7-cyano-7-deazaguanine synthase QueC [Desulfosporosinus fructosivorans]
MDSPRSAIVLLSGGIDSTTCAVLACREFGPENVLALSLFYGQKHAKEIDAAREVSKHLGLKDHIIQQLPDIFKGGGSTLIDQDRQNPEKTYEELSTSQGISPTYVPFRNANLLSVATSISLIKGADTIFYGAHSEDARNWAYPDCTPEFNGAMANAIYIGSYMKVRLVTPLQWFSKSEVVALGKKIGTPFQLTWSCYNGKEKACGVCPACVGRLHGFEENGLIDPIEYETGRCF